MWPTDDILDALEALPRPDRPGVRWTRRDQWHVTLRFLGRVDDPAEALAALATADAPRTEAVLGPEVTRLGRGVVCVDVRGLDEVAAAVVEATASVGRPPEPRPFAGHVTLARVKGGGMRGLLGAAVSGRWSVDRVHLVQSRLHPHGARYESVATVPLRDLSMGA